MDLTKEQLATKKGSDVRHNGPLFDLFKKYIIEDWGHIPAGCFGCDFNKHFQKWSQPYLKKTKSEIKKREIMQRDYILKDENYKTFFKGEVLSKNSSSSEWAEFVKENPAQEEKRRNLFSKLPSSLTSDAEKAIEDEKVEKDELEKKPESVLPADVRIDPETGMIIHVVTEKTLEDNPGLAEEGVQVGDEILIDPNETEETETEETETEETETEETETEETETEETETEETETDSAAEDFQDDLMGDNTPNGEVKKEDKPKAKKASAKK